MVCALIVSATALALPLFASYITKNILGSNTPDVLGQIYRMGGLMLLLLLVHTLCNMFVDYQGHMMGASWNVICVVSSLSIYRNCPSAFMMSKKQVS